LKGELKRWVCGLIGYGAGEEERLESRFDFYMSKVVRAKREERVWVGSRVK
jgi:hypothetical protein